MVRTRKKIVATIENARTMLRLDGEYAGFAKYLRSFASYDELATDLRAQFAFLGPLSVYYFTFLVDERVPRFEDWEQTVTGDHPRMREMIAHARASGYDG
jgi:3-methyladenine DNA glycosylase Tag